MGIRGQDNFAIVSEIISDLKVWGQKLLKPAQV
jgi:hypothetical protein